MTHDITLWAVLFFLSESLSYLPLMVCHLIIVVLSLRHKYRGSKQTLGRRTSLLMSHLYWDSHSFLCNSPCESSLLSLHVLRVSLTGRREFPCSRLHARHHVDILFRLKIYIKRGDAIWLTTVVISHASNIPPFYRSLTLNVGDTNQHVLFPPSSSFS